MKQTPGIHLDAGRLPLYSNSLALDSGKMLITSGPGLP